MADKAISELVVAQQVTPTDLFVLEQSGTAKKLTGQTLGDWLRSMIGHGGIQSVVKYSTDGLEDTYRFTFSDSTTFDFVVTNGKDGQNGKDGYTPIKGVDYFDGEDGYTPIKGYDYVDGQDGKSAYQYAKEAGYTGNESMFAKKLAEDAYAVVTYNAADAEQILDAILTGKPVYCLYDIYYLPLVNFDGITNTASFGGCFDNKVITCKAVNGVWNVYQKNIDDSSGGNEKPSTEIFIGDDSTTVAEYYEACQNGKVCFMERNRGGSGKWTWMMVNVNTSKADFHSADYNGNVMYGRLLANGTWNYQTNSGGTDSDGLTNRAKTLLITILRNGVYSTDQSNNITALAAEFGMTEDVPDVPVDPEVTLSGISATYSGGDVAIGTALTSLTGSVVTAVYSDDSTATVTD